MENFRDLKVWAKAHDLTLRVYALTRTFPREELYGLTSQIRRSTASVGTNIAEGCGRRSDGEFGRFLQIARGSACEVEYQLLLAKDLGLMSIDAHGELHEMIQEIQRMLAVLVQRVQRDRKAAVNGS